jgi:excisionase family DNA binding protein
MVTKLDTVQIISSPDLLGGKPCIEGRRITVQQIVEDVIYGGMDFTELEAAYQLRPSEIHAALSYYYDHEDEIDQSIREDDQDDPSDKSLPYEVHLQFMKEALTTKHAAEKLGISERAVRQLIDSGTLPAQKFGGVWFVHPKALDLPSVRERRPGRKSLR